MPASTSISARLKRAGNIVHAQVKIGWLQLQHEGSSASSLKALPVFVALDTHVLLPVPDAHLQRSKAFRPLQLSLCECELRVNVPLNTFQPNRDPSTERGGRGAWDRESGGGGGHGVAPRA